MPQWNGGFRVSLLRNHRKGLVHLVTNAVHLFVPLQSLPE